MHKDERRWLMLVWLMVVVGTGQGCGAPIDGDLHEDPGFNDVTDPRDPEPGDENPRDPEPGDEEPRDPEPDDEGPPPAEVELDVELLMLGSSEGQFVWGTADDDLFMAGEGGLFAHFDGERWRPLEVEDDHEFVELESIFGFSSTDIYVGDANGDVAHFDGESWKVLDGPGLSDGAFVWGSAPDDVYAVGGSELAHFDGVEWTKVNTGLPTDVRWQGISGSGPDDMILVGRNTDYPFEGRLATFDGREWTLWRLPRTGELEAVWSAGPNLSFAVGRAGTIIHRDGSAVTPMASGTARGLYGITGTSRVDVFAGGDGVLLHFDGKEWAEIERPPTEADYLERPVRSLFALPSGELLASAGGVYGFDGDAWETKLSNGGYVAGIWATSSDDVTFGGVIAHHYDGRDAVPIDFGGLGPQRIQALAGVGQVAFAVSNDGGVFRRDGDSWGMLSDQLPFEARDLHATSGEAVVAVGADGDLARFDGERWTSAMSPGVEGLRSVWSSTEGDLYVAGTDEKLRHFDGESWTTALETEEGSFRHVFGFDDGTVLAVHSQDGIYVLDGPVWTLLKPEVDGASVSIRTVHGTGLDDLFAASNRGLLHYDGESWSVVPTGSANRFVDVFAVTSGEVYASSEEGVFKISGIR